MISDSKRRDFAGWLSGLIAAVCFCCGCSVADFGGEASVAESYPVEVIVNNGVYTKISAPSSPDYSINWERGDRVKMRAIDGDGIADEKAEAELIVYDIDAGESSAVFKGSVSLSSEPLTCNFAYPSSSAISDDGASITYSFDNQTGGHSPFLYGKADYRKDGFSCQMASASGMLHLSVPSNVSSVIVKGNSGEKLSKFDCNPGTGEIRPADDAAAEFAVNTGGAGECWIAMPPVNFAKGFSLVFVASNGSKMYKSYSSGGGPDSGYDFRAGTLVEIDAGEFNAFSMNVSASAAHTKNSSGQLDGTSVTISCSGRTGAPGKIISSWGADVMKSDGTVVRSYSGNVAESSASMTVVDGWTYLPEGSYTVRPFAIVNGERVELSESSLIVPSPDFSVSVNAETSYSVYRKSGAAAANGKDGSSIFGISSFAGIAPELAANSKYGLKVRYTTDSGKDSGERPLSSNSDSFGSFDLLPWNKHVLKAEVNFAGTVRSASIDCHVTGLPRNADPPSKEGGWTEANGNNIEWRSDCVSLSTVADAPEIVSPTFHIPEDISVSVSLKAVRNKFTFGIVKPKGNLQVYNVKNNKLYDRSMAQEETVTLTDSPATMTLSSSVWHVKYDYRATGPITYIYYFNIKYR